MRKIFLVFLAGIMVLGSTACTWKQTEKTEKIAVVRNLSKDDHTAQYLQGAEGEGQSLGYQVDIYLTDGDDEKMQQTLKTVIKKEYDGLIISHGKEEYAQKLIEEAVKKNIKVVTFDTVSPPIEGVTATAQDDDRLARLSLDAVIAQSAEKPAKLVKVWYDETLAPFSKRSAVYEEYEKKGLIKTVYEIYPKVPADQVRTAVRDAFEAMGREVQADGVWAAWDELAKGVYDAGCTLPMASIDISDEDIGKMREKPKVWTASAAVNAKVAGMMDMRILAKKLHGEQTPAQYHMEASLITAEDARKAGSVTGLDLVIDGFRANDTFLEDWMKERKTLHQKNVAQITYQSKLMDQSFNQLVWDGLNALSYQAALTHQETINAFDFKERLQELIRQQKDLIVASSNQAAEEIKKAAKQNPGLSFICLDVDYEEPAKNLTGLIFDDGQAGFLAGYAAARTTKTGKIGFIGGMEDAAIRRFEHGFTAGARYAKKEVEIFTDYAGSYGDPEKGKALALDQYKNGADVIFQAAGATGLGVIEGAKEVNRWVIGVDYDQSFLAPGQVLTSVVKRVDVAARDVVSEFLSGQQIGGKNYKFGVAEQGIDILQSRHLNPVVYQELQAVKEKIIKGEIVLPE